MPPKIKVTKEDIIAAALDVVRESGADSLNARAVAKKLDCSTQPIFTNYATMEELKSDVVQAADRIYHAFLERGMKDTQYPPYKASGVAYIRFAKDEKELFKLLFMRDRSQEVIKDEKEGMAPLISLVSSNTGLGFDDAHLFHVEMWLYVHGIATTVATSYLEWNEDLINRILTDAYESMKVRYEKLKI